MFLIRLLLKIPYDKALHFIVGVLTYLVFHFANPYIGLAAGVVIGIGKEIYDYYHQNKDTPEVMDAVSTILGAIVAFICSINTFLIQ